AARCRPKRNGFHARLLSGRPVIAGQFLSAEAMDVAEFALPAGCGSIRGLACRMSPHNEAGKSVVVSAPAETEQHVTAGNITKPTATIAKLVATIAAIPLLPTVLRMLLWRYQSMTWSQGAATYLLVLLPFWIALWRPQVPPARRITGFAAGLGN